MQRWERPPMQELADPGESPNDFKNYVSLGEVGYDPKDPTLAYVRQVDGQRIVEVTLADGDDVNAYLCHQQVGGGGGDYIPVEPGDAVVILWPDGQGETPYLVARLADLEHALAATVCGIDTSTKLGQLDLVRQFRWTRTPDGQVYAIQAGGEMLLHGGGAGVRLKGAQIVLQGGVHLGADFTTQPYPGEVVGGEVPATLPAAPFIPIPDVSLSLDPQPPQLRDGIVRFADPIEANVFTDEDFFLFILTINTFISAAAIILGLPWPYADPENMPTRIVSGHVRASRRHTAND